MITPSNMRPEKRLYAVFKGDVFIDVGTASELSKRLGIKKASIRNLSQPSQKKAREGTNAMYITKIEE